jgi:putative flippase GtrA
LLSKSICPKSVQEKLPLQDFFATFALIFASHEFRVKKANEGQAPMMRNFLKQSGLVLQRLIVFFYPPFRKVVNKQVFLYAVTGGMNVLFDWTLYFSTYNFILQKQNLNLGLTTLSPHVAALTITFPISFSSGFLLQKYVTFSGSPLRGKTQVSRYMVVVALNFLVNFVGIKILVDALHLFPTPSKMIITGFTVILSYLFQKKFTFKA